MSQLGFDFGVEPRRLTRVTPARLSTFDDCPRRYRMSYLDQPTPQRTGPWAHSTLGAVVHNAMRALFHLPVERRTPERAAALVGAHWKDAGFADAGQAVLYREYAQGWVARYVEDHDVTADPVGLERWVSAPAGPDERDPSLIVEGRVDRIDVRDGECVIVDYKTGQRRPDEETAHRSRALALYAVAVAKSLHRPCRRVELHHLPSGTVAAAEHTRDSLRDHLHQAEQTATALRTATDTLVRHGDADTLFPARTARRCGWCEFRPSCPEGQLAAPAARSWQLLDSRCDDDE